jgi:hypothetical protein
MKYHILPILLLMLGLMVVGCGNGVTTVPVTASTESLVVEDRASLIAALQAAGATLEVGDSISQDFFSPEGSIIMVNGAEIQAFEYASADAMETEASEVAPDGGAIGTSMVSWMDAPHFYKTGRIIALYVGSDQTVLDLLEMVVGPQFAGQ